MVPLFLCPALDLLFFYFSTSWKQCAVPNMAIFCNSLTSWFPDMLPTYFLYDFEMVPVAPIITVITSAFTFHMRCIFIVRSLYFKIISAIFNHISVSWNCSIYYHVCSLFIVSDYNIWLVTGDSSVSLHLLIPQYSHLSPLICYYWFWHMFVPVILHPSFFAYVEVYLCTHSIMPFYTLFFCQYWAWWYYMVYYIIIIIPKLYLNTGTASTPIALILFLVFSSDFRIIINLLLYSCFNLSFICWCCIPPLSSIPK